MFCPPTLPLSWTPMLRVAASALHPNALETPTRPAPPAPLAPAWPWGPHPLVQRAVATAACGTTCVACLQAAPGSPLPPWVCLGLEWAPQRPWWLARPMPRGWPKPAPLHPLLATKSFVGPVSACPPQLPVVCPVGPCPQCRRLVPPPCPCRPPLLRSRDLGALGLLYHPVGMGTLSQTWSAPSFGAVTAPLGTASLTAPCPGPPPGPRTQPPAPVRHLPFLSTPLPSLLPALTLTPSSPYGWRVTCSQPPSSPGCGMD